MKDDTGKQNISKNKINPENTKYPLPKFLCSHNWTSYGNLAGLTADNEHLCIKCPHLNFPSGGPFLQRLAVLSNSAYLNYISIVYSVLS